MRISKHAFAAALAVSLATAALADEKPAQLAAITIENDFFAGYDHNYTNGVQAAFVASPSTVFAFGQRVYTPVGGDRVPLRYGNTYQFRVRLMDLTGGGPDSSVFTAPASGASIPFRRFVPPKAAREQDC